MLAPTLLSPHGYLLGTTEDGVAVIALHGEEWMRDEFEIACCVHTWLHRGLLVVAV